MYLVLLVCACAVALLPVVGFIYQWWGVRSDRSLMAPGKLIDIGGGRRLYSLHKGHGSPAVIFESGFAATSLNWMEIQDAISQSAETIVYDRSGLGWSTGPTAERTPTRIAEELRTLLHETGIKPPYILVGHSFGGLVMRRYALEYLHDVAGVVLVDPMRTEEWPPVSERQRPLVNRAHRLTGHAVNIARIGAARLAVRSLLCRSGRVSGAIGRISGNQGKYLLERLTAEVGKMPAAVRPGVAAHWADPLFYQGMRDHLQSLTATVEEMHDAHPIDGVPVLVLTPVSAEPLSEEDLQRIGTDARQVIADKSKHWIHLDEPELVIAAILEMRCAALERSALEVRTVA